MRTSARSWIVLSLLGLVLSIAAAQAASSGTLVISGVVPLVNDLVVTALASNNTSLNIVGGETAKQVANVAETSNNASGYTVTLSSANGGQLRLSSDPSKRTTYTVAYGIGGYAAPNVAPTTVKTVSTLAAQTTATSAVRVNVAAFAAAPAGTYSDTITLAIVANP